MYVCLHVCLISGYVFICMCAQCVCVCVCMSVSLCFCLHKCIRDYVFLPLCTCFMSAFGLRVPVCEPKCPAIDSSACPISRNRGYGSSSEETAGEATAGTTVHQRGFKESCCAHFRGEPERGRRNIKQPLPGWNLKRNKHHTCTCMHWDTHSKNGRDWETEGLMQIPSAIVHSFSSSPTPHVLLLESR